MFYGHLSNLILYAICRDLSKLIIGSGEFSIMQKTGCRIAYSYLNMLYPAALL